MKIFATLVTALILAAPALAQLTDVHTQQKARAQNACSGLVARHEAAVAGGMVSSYLPEDCSCFADSITWEGWDDYEMGSTGEYMTEADAILVADTLSSAPTIDDAMTLIYESISSPGSSVLSNCIAK